MSDTHHGVAGRPEEEADALRHDAEQLADRQEHDEPCPVGSLRRDKVGRGREHGAQHHLRTGARLARDSTGFTGMTHALALAWRAHSAWRLGCLAGLAVSITWTGMLATMNAM